MAINGGGGGIGGDRKFGYANLYDDYIAPDVFTICVEQKEYMADYLRKYEGNLVPYVYSRWPLL